jgi:TAT (twin-arginine translocation) pathway signal sequence
MNRRDFLKLSTGAAVALAWPVEVVAGRSWTWVKATGFRRARDSTAWVGQLLALRSDGEYFYVVMPIAAEHFTEEAVDGALLAGHQMLETFLGCGCIAGTPCPEHPSTVGDLEWAEAD